MFLAFTLFCLAGGNIRILWQKENRQLWGFFTSHSTMAPFAAWFSKDFPVKDWKQLPPRKARRIQYTGNELCIANELLIMLHQKNWDGHSHSSVCVLTARPLITCRHWYLQHTTKRSLEISESKGTKVNETNTITSAYASCPSFGIKDWKMPAISNLVLNIYKPWKESESFLARIM